MLHLFDKPEPGPTVCQLLEGFWDATERRPEFDRDTGKVVWVLERVYLGELGDDAFCYEIFESKEAALWSRWREMLDEALDLEADEKGQCGFDATGYLADCFDELQNLRDDEFHQDCDILYRLSEKEVM